eukprot:TRINITY_DN4901_c0_g1_i2.p1 TRINITY_DN4901_c0_g1~~TRINITY_DN4901_c0_g1_i2.p1  ORF type:complete len:171 (-),score=19.36 TRINITY_DN4901_c0_g1_i2:694-1206(-)
MRKARAAGVKQLCFTCVKQNKLLHTETKNPIKIISWNINGLNGVLTKSPHHLAQLLTNHNPDILCLQETKVQYAKIPQVLNTTVGNVINPFNSQPFIQTLLDGAQSKKHKSAISIPEDIFKDFYPYRYWNSSTFRLGYSGTSIFSKIPPKRVHFGFPSSSRPFPARFSTD